MSTNTAVINLVLKAADDTVSRLLQNVVKGVQLPLGAIYEREYPVSNTPVTHIGMANAALTVVIPAGKVDLNFTIGSATFSYTNVSTPVVLPGAITSLQMVASDADLQATVYIFQGS